MTTTLAAERVTGDDAAPAQPPHAVQRLRLAMICAALTALVFAQSAGSVAPDTKLDLVVDPLRFLARTLTLWDPRGAAGQLQNQAYGYLFPMGPFFALGKLMALPAWVIQRAWESTLVLAAFLGMVRLSGLLGVRAFWPKVGTGLAYALAPRMLAEMGSISSELMPMAALPWILVPLVRGASYGSPRRAAARSGVAILFAGGVNAAATIAILPAPVLWLLSRERGPRRRALMAWWTLALILACAWWMVPLLLLGRYSPPFLDWIESSEVTTGVTSLIASLRGVDHWEAYLGPTIWPAGWILVAAPAAIAATALVAAAGVAGLSRSDLAHRVFLRSCLTLGLLLVTAGYLATVGPPFAGPVRSLLDGPLNAFRNVHKFDPLIRLPVAVGVGHLLGRVQIPARLVVHRRRSPLELRPRGLAVVLVLAVAAVAITPAITNKLIPQPRVLADAPWWHATGTWLGSHDGAGRALVVPGAARPVYLWGSTVDDALQPVSTGAWTVRDGVPLTNAGYIRLLDDISLRLAAGRRDEVLSALLARSGIRYLVVRNDLDTERSNATGLPFVHATIDNSPGFAVAASFGDLPSPKPDPRRIVDLGATVPRPLVQVYRVLDWSNEVSLLPADRTVAATGSADELGTLMSAGVVTPNAPVLFGGQASVSRLAALNAVTDGIRRREARFGQAGSYSATMTADQPYNQPRAAQDYLPDDPGPLATIQYGGGLVGVSASSSGADANALVNIGPSHSAWAALDADPSTSWESGAASGAVGQWLSVTLDRPLATSSVEVAFTAGLGGYPNRIRVSTEAGSREGDVAPGPFPQQVQLPPGTTRTLRITVLAASDSARSVGISTLHIPGVTPTRTLAVPSSGRPDVLTFATEPGSRTGCLTVNGRAACDPLFAASGEEDGLIDRTFTLSGPQQYALTARVAPRPGADLDALLDAGAPIKATSSSMDNLDPRERPGAAVDGDPHTSWVAQVGDPQPSLLLELGRPRKVESVRLTTDEGAPVVRPTRVRVSFPGHAWSLRVPADGTIRLPSTVIARTLQITVLQAELRSTTSTVTGKSRLLPVGISEVAINGTPVAARFGTVHVGCADGLIALIDGVPIALQATLTRSEVLAGQEVTATACEGTTANLKPGANRVRLSSSALLVPESITLTRPGALPLASGADTTATPLHWGATRREVQVSTPTAAFLVVRENANAGWRATLDGHRLASVRLDGWQQGWLVPADSTGVITLTYTPQSAFGVGLLAGLLAALAVVAFALLRARDRPYPAVGERSVGASSLMVGAVVAAFLLAGVTGLIVAVCALLLRWIWQVLLGRALPWWAGGLAVGLAGCAEAYLPSGTPHPLAGSPLVQVLCVAAVCLMIIGVTPGRLQEREKRRSSGRSKQYQETAPSNVAEPAVSRKYSR